MFDTIHRIIVVFVMPTLMLFANNIPSGLSDQISHIPINKANYSIHIQAVDSPLPVASWRTGVKRSPASVIKLLTTYSSLLKLGFEYQWETKFYHTGKIKNGVLYGDLYVKASGDPTLETADVYDIAHQVTLSGIRAIKGNIAIDRTRFKVANKNNSGFDRNLYSPYNAMPDAIMFNKRKSTICITPRTKRAKVEKDVPDQSYKVVNNLRMVNGSCRAGRSWPKVSIKTNDSGRSTVFLSGKLSKRCGKRKVCKVISMPHRAFYYTLKDALKAENIKFAGTLKLRRVPTKARYLFSHHSDTLESVASVINKKSDNLMARQLMLTMGAESYQEPSTLMKSRKAVQNTLNHYHILQPNTTHISNGSGLSRSAKLTAKSLANLLDHAYKTYGYRWMNTLAVAGVDGTIKRRFQNSVVYGRAWMKTGTIKRVKNIAGYVEGASGQIYVVVVLVNDQYSRKYGAKLANNVIEWVATSL
ncbi:MAG TPA: D-alanyl-D-alanine carboxypeptidase/D-alanyl-D-alanine-endopeptidase [Campylobacterales bacterium]|nr:D-alanyl-D-alanine carboxypeptidase/D-alanyl-D-alanine-endopeptidase [Campylobacterales bacterium]HHS92254.1 D-alanyl-D-alanine carboxypeptidase/D-alanyl-D-alanine-endopeptidase [Campylobacterales bacterium]